MLIVIATHTSNLFLYTTIDSYRRVSITVDQYHQALLHTEAVTIHYYQLLAINVNYCPISSPRATPLPLSSVLCLSSEQSKPQFQLSEFWYSVVQWCSMLTCLFCNPVSKALRIWAYSPIPWASHNTTNMSRCVKFLPLCIPWRYMFAQGTHTLTQTLSILH